MSAYWCNDSRGVMLTAAIPGATSTTVGPTGPGRPSIFPRRSTAAVWAISTRLPRAAAARASAAATVVRPTPPFPDRINSRLSNSDGTAGATIDPDDDAMDGAMLLEPVHGLNVDVEEIAEQRQRQPGAGHEGGGAAHRRVVAPQADAPGRPHGDVHSQRAPAQQVRVRLAAARGEGRLQLRVDGFERTDATAHPQRHVGPIAAHRVREGLGSYDVVLGHHSRRAVGLGGRRAGGVVRVAVARRRALFP